MSKIFAITIPALVLAAALASGFLQYAAQPMGDLFYTPAAGECPTYAHSFTTGYGLALFSGALLWLASGILCGLMGWVTRKQGLSRSIRQWTLPALAGCLFLMAAWFTHPLFEYALPLQDPPCLARGS